MSLKSRLFGRKVKGEVLESLMKALDISGEYVENYNEKWSVYSVWGKYLTKFGEEGLNVDLTLYRKDVHWVNPENGPFKYFTEEYDFNKTIPYEKLKE